MSESSGGAKAGTDDTQTADRRRIGLADGSVAVGLLVEHIVVQTDEGAIGERTDIHLERGAKR